MTVRPYKKSGRYKRYNTSSYTAAKIVPHNKKNSSLPVGKSTENTLTCGANILHTHAATLIHNSVIIPYTVFCLIESSGFTNTVCENRSYRYLTEPHIAIAVTYNNKLDTVN